METNATTTNAEAVPQPSALERTLELSVVIADLDKEIDQRLKRLGKNVKMPGFRPGKVPANIIKQQYGYEARMEALGEAIWAKENFPIQRGSVSSRRSTARKRSRMPLV